MIWHYRQIPEGGNFLDCIALMHHRMVMSRARILLIVGLIAVAANLRTPFTSLPPLLGVIREHFSLGTTAAGFLTTLPLLAFAAVSPFASAVGRRFGLERTLLGVLLLIAAGAGLRFMGTVASLYLGTFIIGGGIALGNVLLPSLLKRDFPERIPLLTAVYVLTMGVMAGLGSAIAVPLVDNAGLAWPSALLIIALVPAFLSALIWLPQLGRHSMPVAGAPAPKGASLWRSPLAWQVTLFLGCNSILFYITVSWLPAILQTAGYSAAAAGSIHGVLQIAAAVPGVILAPVINRMRDLRLVALGASILTMAGFIGFLMAPSLSYLWTVVYALGGGTTIILGLAFVSLRVTTVTQAAGLSGMAQSVGYLFAASGPTLAGLMHEALGNWNGVLILCIIISLMMAVMGMFAGRDVRVPAP